MVSLVRTQPEYAVGRDNDPHCIVPSRDRVIQQLHLSVELLEQIGGSQKLYRELLNLMRGTTQLATFYPVHTQSTIRTCRALIQRIISVIDSNKSDETGRFFIPIQQGQTTMEEMLQVFKSNMAHFESDAITLPDPQSSPGDQ